MTTYEKISLRLLLVIAGAAVAIVSFVEEHLDYPPTTSDVLATEVENISREMNDA